MMHDASLVCYAPKTALGPGIYKPNITFPVVIIRKPSALQNKLHPSLEKGIKSQVVIWLSPDTFILPPIHLMGFSTKEDRR